MMRRRGQGNGLCFAAALLGLAWLGRAACAAQPVSDGEGEGDFDDPIRPIPSYDLRYRYENDANDSSTTRNDKQFITLRRTVRRDFNKHWRLYVRGDLPLVFANATSNANPNGGYAFGLGRPLFQTYIINAVNDRWGWAVGEEFIMPAGS
ncbi:MAG TPA: hypothetical protein VHY34_12830, partial [Caulobacteraceae bacterium]|nr:hypothetical protein [Caulobacteraceae bacterium]